LFRRYAHRLIFFDLVDAKIRMPGGGPPPAEHGKMEKAGSQNGTFMLSNRDYGDCEVDLEGNNAHCEERGLQGMHRRSLGRRQRTRSANMLSTGYPFHSPNAFPVAQTA
jgi:hypothetical protein